MAKEWIKNVECAFKTNNSKEIFDEIKRVYFSKDFELEEGCYKNENDDPYVYLTHNYSKRGLKLKIDFGIHRSEPIINICIKKQDNKCISDDEIRELSISNPILKDVSYGMGMHRKAIHLYQYIAINKSATNFINDIKMDLLGLVKR